MVGKGADQPRQALIPQTGSSDSPCAPVPVIFAGMIEDEADLLADIRFALRGLDPWPPKGDVRPSKDQARKVVEHLRLCGWEVRRPSPRRRTARPEMTAYLPLADPSTSSTTLTRYGAS
jgi:hypothetical protein